MEERLRHLERQNAELLSIVQSIKDVDVEGWLDRGFILPTEIRARIQAALASPSANRIGEDAAPATGRTYTREEVQKWRDDIAHAAADIVESAAPSFGSGDWSWLVNGIRALAKNPQANTPAADSNALPPLPRSRRFVNGYSESDMREYALESISKHNGSKA